MLRLTTLGAKDLRDRLGHPVRDVLDQPKRVALLVYLVLEGSRGPVSRDRLLAMFWPESDSAHARNALSQALHHLRQALGADVIEGRGVNAVQVRLDILWCDATAFSEALERGDVELALDLYRGEFCPALFTRGSPELEEWLDRKRRELGGRALAAARRLAEQMLVSGDAPGAARAARRALAMLPEDEADVRALLLLLEQAGDRPGALLAYREYAHRLAQQLETEPAAETRRLAEQMRRRQDPLDHTGAESAAALAHASPARVIVRTGSLPRLAFLALFVAALLTVSVVVLRGRAHPPAAQPMKTLAVFPFTLRGGAPASYLADGMVDLLSAKLEGASGFHAIDPRTVLAAFNRQENGGNALDVTASARMARELGAGWYITGDVVEVAGGLQVNGALVDVSAGSRTIANVTVSGDTAALFQLVDDLTGQMLVHLAPGRDTVLTQLAAVTTHSLPALRRFLDGERAVREGEDAAAASAFRDAAVLDTTFALAQYRLAVTATWAYIPGIEAPTFWAAKASRHSGRLTPLARDLLDAYRAYRELRGDDAERLYRSITSAYPDNSEAWFMLGETYFHYNTYRGRDPMEAWTPFQRVLQLQPANSHAMLHLARLSAANGRAATLDSLVERYHELYPSADRAMEMRALQAFVHDDPAGKRETFALARDADLYQLTSILQAAILYAQNLDAARGLFIPFRQAQDTSPGRMMGWAYQTELPLMAGRWSMDWKTGRQELPWFNPGLWQLETRALLAVEPMLGSPASLVTALRDSIAGLHPYPSMSPPIGATSSIDLGDLMRPYLLGLLSARLGDTVSAARHAAALARVRDTARSRQARDLALGVRAEIARAGGRNREALALLEQFRFDVGNPGVFSLAHWGVHERFLRAELLHALGEDEEALAWYRSFQNNYDAPWIPLTHYRLGEIYSTAGNRERATFHYSRFIALWHQSDARFQPMLDQARAAMR
jgi:DNA-binding SARP family transcriptional activator/TolB-like protein